MLLSLLAIPAVIILLLSAVILLVSNNWRLSIGALGALYLGVFVLVANTWPTDLAVVKLVTGWMAGSVLGMTSLNIESQDSITRRVWPTQSMFYLMAAALVLATVSTFIPYLLEWIPTMTAAQAWGGLSLIGLGLLHLGFSARAMRVIISLLTLLAGFEILYAVVEVSTLVTTLLALVTLGISLAGAYLVLNPTMEVQQG